MKLLWALLFTEGILVQGFRGIRGVTKDAARRQLAKGGIPGPPGGVGEETAGNNLAVPILVAEDQFQGTSVTGDPQLSLPLLDFSYEPVPDAVCLTELPYEGQVCYYDDTIGIAWLQRSDNKWGCWLMPSAFYYGDPFTVTTVDVGDRLESPSSIPIGGTKIRVEVTMLQGGLPEPTVPSFDFGPGTNVPQALPMEGPFLGTLGIDEIHGTTTFRGVNPGSDGTVSELGDLVWEDPPFTDGLQAIVYSNCAKYYIQQLEDYVAPEDPPGSTLRFDYNDGKWVKLDGTSSAGPVLVDVDPPGEITVSGKFTFGYNWNVKKYVPGVYRITFLIDPNCSYTNAVIQAPGTTIYEAPETEESIALAEDTGETESLTSYVIEDGQYVDEYGNSGHPGKGGGVYIDVPIAPKSGGGGGGGKGGKQRN